ncbi:MAG: diguanylate cyclase [Deltaproteobacteria bacterium]|nr:diguanylate cyclase [Deltaproteobacteria bacterium]
MSHFPILVAEDNPVSRKLLEKTLVKAGHKVVSVENGRKALEVFKEVFFPIVLTDWMMPEMDGLELCRAIRKDTSKGYVFIVLLTAKDSKDDIVSGLEAGADDYLTKPLNNAELIARIKTGIRILELERALKKANEKNRILSITDPLTKIYNRGYLNQHLSEEIKRARRYKRPLSLILCDIDHFKKVNDTYGHQIGDQVLKEFVQCIKESIRYDVDWVVRYGGEEFIVVLPETDLRSACFVAERLRNVIAMKTIEVKDKVIHITASFGVNSIDSTTPDDKISSNAIINEADRCLYLAKQEGRNRVNAGITLLPIHTLRD